MLKLILASQSPRRIELLKKAGFHFTVLPVNLSEIPDKNLNLDQQILKIAQEKAEACLEENNHLKQKDFLILAADTMVILDGVSYGKPQNKEEAVEHLTRLSGRTHIVKTGVFMLNCQSFDQASEVTTTNVTFRRLENQEIRDYVASGEPMDKAGSYGIQGVGSHFVSQFEGPFDNVMGLSIESVRKLLTEKSWSLE